MRVIRLGVSLLAFLAIASLSTTYAQTCPTISNGDIVTEQIYLNESHRDGNPCTSFYDSAWDYRAGTGSKPVSAVLYDGTKGEEVTVTIELISNSGGTAPPRPVVVKKTSSLPLANERAVVGEALNSERAGDSNSTKVFRLPESGTYAILALRSRWYRSGDAFRVTVQGKEDTGYSESAWGSETTESSNDARTDESSGFGFRDNLQDRDSRQDNRTSFERIHTVDFGKRMESQYWSIRSPWGMTGGEYGLLCKPDAGTVEGSAETLNPWSNFGAEDYADDAVERGTGTESLYAAEGNHECEDDSPVYGSGVESAATLFLSDLISEKGHRNASRVKVEIEYRIPSLGDGDALTVNMNGHESERIARSTANTSTVEIEDRLRSNSFLQFNFTSDSSSSSGGSMWGNSGWGNSDADETNAEGPYIERVRVYVRQ